MNTIDHFDDIEATNDDFPEEETIENEFSDKEESETETAENDNFEEDDRPEPIVYSQEDDLRLLEAVLFASAEPLSRKVLENYLPDRDIDALLTQLEVMYGGRGVNLVQTGEAWAFRTAPDLASHLGSLTQAPRRLSRAVTETLAIIAYHQPVTRGEIEQIRGVATHKGALDTLVELEWIKPGRRRETLGRPVTWVTTPAFLDHFSLTSIADLPGIEELKASGLLDTRPVAATLFDRLEEIQMQEPESEEVD